MEGGWKTPQVCSEAVLWIPGRQFVGFEAFCRELANGVAY